LHEILAGIADRQLAALRESRAKFAPQEIRQQTRESWSRLLGDTEPPQEIKVREGSKSEEKVGALRVVRELLETEPGIGVPVMTLSAPREGAGPPLLPIIVGVSADGTQPALERQRDNLAAALKAGVTVVLVEVRGTGASNPEKDRGQQSGATSYAATALMLGQPVLGGQLHDLRTAWQHVKRGEGGDQRMAVAVGGSGVEPLEAGATFSFPRRIDGRPPESRPSGALLAALLALYEDDFGSVAYRRGLASYRRVLDSPFVQVPHEAIVPGLLRKGDIPDLFEALGGRGVEIEHPVDGLGRLATDPRIATP
jgi:hypothetical protein